MSGHIWRGLVAANRANPTERNVPVGKALSAAYGTRNGRPDTNAAAAALGVSQRTVQRWVKAGKFPSTPAGAQAAEAGRQAQMPPTREKRYRKQGALLGYRGKVIISNDNRNNRVRHFNYQLSPDEISRIIDAARNDGEAAALTELENTVGGMFGGSVSLDPDMIVFLDNDR